MTRRKISNGITGERSAVAGAGEESSVAAVVVVLVGVVGVEVDSAHLLIAVMGQSCTTFQCQCLWSLILTADVMISDAEAQEVSSHVTEADIFPETCHLGTLTQSTPLLSTTACLTSCTMTVTQITRFTKPIKDPTNTPQEIIIFELFN
jgi:hypothetical protein